jgi:hypothetical protein
MEPRARKRIFIHIGTHKTGTTSIQMFLHQNRSRLKKAGILVPRSGTGVIDSPAGHQNIAYELCGSPHFERGLGRTANLLEELHQSQEPVAVISSENFQFLHRFPDKLSKLDQDLDALGYDRTYLVYFRNTRDYFVSLYGQLKFSDRSPPGTFATLQKDMRAKGFVLDRVGRYFEFDYDRLIRDWEAIVGKNIMRFDYDAVTKAGGLLVSFLQTIGAPADLASDASAFPRFNVSKVGRNDPCPCQSGKKYKQCHGIGT